ncbi:MAG: DUF5916 domain-containing protein [Vicinamibacteria bacterium]
MRALAVLRDSRERCHLIAFFLLMPASWAQAQARNETPGPVKTVSREADQTELGAVALGDQLIKVDGRLDEPVYARIKPASDFIQQEPSEGQKATEKTEVWVFFDERNVYVSARCLDSHPERMIANEMRRDHFNLFENENFAVVFDTFHDKRNGYMFYTTPLGGLFDGLITDETNINRDWNTVWDAKASRDELGWTVEFVIPFKSLRYGASDVWGINFRRRVRWKNETSYLTMIPASFGRRGLTKLSSAADLTGIKAPASSRAFEIKPYATGSQATDRALASPHKGKGEAGFDAKVTLSSALTLDLTYNTDFAQVEDDLQQVNLSRFSVFFPEKRDFFLEGQGIFSLGSQGGGGGGGGGQFGQTQTPILFFSRRIGLSGDRLIPIQAGGRVTGKVAGWSVGALQMRTGRDDLTNTKTTDFSVLRLKRDVLKRSTIGAIVTRRDDTSATPTNLVYGADLNLGLGSTVRMTGIAAQSDSGASSPKDNLFYQARFEWNADRYGTEIDHVKVDANFSPGIGFVPRPNIDRDQVRLRFSPRPRRPVLKRVRKFTWGTNFDNIAKASSGNFESRQYEMRSETEFQNGDQFNLQYRRNREAVATPFEVSGGLIVPVGSYRFNSFEVRYQMGQQRKFAGSLSFQHGGFYGGSRTEYQYSQGRIELSSRLSVEPQIQINRLDTPFGQVTTKLVSGRLNWTFSPRMLLSGLTQYNSTTSQLISNVRFRWEYQPGSDLFVVYGDGRDTEAKGFPALATRSLVVKFTRLFRF